MPTAIKPATKTNRSQSAGPGRLPDIVGTTLVTGAVLVAAIALLEGLFGIAGIGKSEFLDADPVYGFAPMPGVELVFRREGFGHVRFNSLGMHDVERQFAKAKGTHRIAIVGDSLTESVQVDLPNTFCQKLEQRLNQERPDRRTEVLNLGVSSHNLSQVYLRTKKMAMKFAPDVVIWPARVDSLLQLAPNAHGGFFYNRPSIFIGPNNTLIEDHAVMDVWKKTPEAKRMRATRVLREHSHIWGVIGMAYEQWSGWYNKMLKGQGRWGAPVTEKQTAFASAGAGSGSAEKDKKSELIESKPRTANEDGCLNFFGPTIEQILAHMKSECQAHGARFVIVRLPGPHGYSYDYETALIERTAAKLAIPFMDMSEPFRQAAPILAKPLFYDTHLSPAGHELCAQLLHTYLQDEHLLSGDNTAAEETPAAPKNMTAQEGRLE